MGHQQQLLLAVSPREHEMKSSQEELVPVLGPDAGQVPGSRLSHLLSLQHYAAVGWAFMNYNVGILINSALKWQELSLALKSGQLGAVRTQTFLSHTTCALFAHPCQPTPHQLGVLCFSGAGG